jgi:hypothetical protein
MLPVASNSARNGIQRIVTTSFASISRGARVRINSRPKPILTRKILHRPLFHHEAGRRCGHRRGSEAIRRRRCANTGRLLITDPLNSHAQGTSTSNARSQSEVLRRTKSESETPFVRIRQLECRCRNVSRSDAHLEARGFKVAEIDAHNSSRKGPFAAKGVYFTKQLSCSVLKKLAGRGTPKARRTIRRCEMGRSKVDRGYALYALMSSP